MLHERRERGGRRRGGEKSKRRKKGQGGRQVKRSKGKMRRGARGRGGRVGNGACYKEEENGVQRRSSVMQLTPSTPCRVEAFSKSIKRTES